jgi:toxin-antitoxin system, antitoxin component, xre family
MNLEKISKDIYNVDAWMDEQYGKVGSLEREELRKEAYAYCVGQIIHDARKQEKNDTNRTCSKNRNE